MRLHSHDPYAAPLIAPVYAPAHAPAAPRVPAAFAQTQRRSAMSSEVDFRRRSGGVRWGRWLVAVVLVTGGVLGAYRQNLLREGARRIGVENKYLYGEKRVTAFVTAKAPPEVTAVLTRLSLLPGPNYVAEVAVTPPPARIAAPTTPETTATAASTSTEKARDSDLKTVSLESLPVLGNEPAPAPPDAAKPPAAAAPPPRAATVTKAPVQSAAAHKSTRISEAVAKTEPKKPEPKPVEPKKAQPPLSAPQANDNPLKAAIRMAIAADASKNK